jgi:hypothetical protein
MNTSRKISIIAAGLFLVLFAGSIVSQRQVQRLRGDDTTLEEILYLPSGKAVKRLSLGYSSLLANIYWTRAVQYFGARHLKHSEHYELLYPLLKITTELDPHLVVAYETGAVFLCQPIPDGAGDPDKAVDLLEKGAKENPEYWHMYFTLGFVHYLERHDPKSAEQAFRTGSEVPGALPWMKIMAARMAEHADDRDTAILLWKAVLDNAHEDSIKQTARKHIESLEAEETIDILKTLVQKYRASTGNSPSTWMEMVRAGILARVPVDPTGHVYKLMPDGSVGVENPKEFPYMGKDSKN